MTRPDLTLIIPAFNEQERIGPCLRAIQAHFQDPDREVEILVVDDGSMDDTADIVRSFISGFASINQKLKFSLICNPVNRGKGYSVSRGVRCSHGRLVAFCDADLSAPLIDLEKVLSALAGADMAVGARMSAAYPEQAQPLHRRMAGIVFSLLTAILCPTGIPDTQCGLKAYRREIALELTRQQTITGFAFDVEHLVIARRLGLRIQVVDVRWSHKSGSTVRLWRDGCAMFLDLWNIRRACVPLPERIGGSHVLAIHGR